MTVSPLSVYASVEVSEESAVEVSSSSCYKPITPLKRSKDIKNRLSIFFIIIYKSLLNIYFF